MNAETIPSMPISLVAEEKIAGIAPILTMAGGAVVAGAPA